MKINLENYIIELDSQGGYNLYKKQIFKTGKNEGEEYTLNMGYNMTTERCIQKIVHENLSSRDETLSLKAFLGEYKKEVEMIRDLIVL